MTDCLIIYDENGFILHTSYGSVTLPKNIKAMITEIPEDEQVLSVDVSNPENPQPITKSLYTSDYETMKQEMESVKLELEQANQVNTYLSVAAAFAAESFTDEQALQVKNLYPLWESFIGESLDQGKRVLYGDKLYKVRQDIFVVLENQPPSIDTAALYEEIVENHEGTLDDPIPYNNNMELEEGKYYSQDGAIYKCTRGTGQAVYNPLKDLIGIYVELAS